MNDSDRIRLPVLLTLMDGQELNGNILASIGGTVERTLNNDAKFISFTDLEERERLIAKTTIAAVEARKTAKIVNLPTEAKVGSSDPYELLGIGKTATDDEIRHAYIQRAKGYHADRYQSIDMPTEVKAYIDSMSRRINEAYRLLSSSKPTQRAAQNGPMFG
ncbi:MAG: J domain-containing protein [Pseudomonadota bacterium]